MLGQCAPEEYQSTGGLPGLQRACTPQSMTFSTWAPRGAWLFACLLSACGSSTLLRVDDATLQGSSEATMMELSKKEHAFLRAQEDEEKALLALRNARLDLEKDHKRLQQLELERSVNEQLFEFAQEQQLGDAARVFQTEVGRLNLHIEAAEKSIELREATLEYAEINHRLHQSKTKVADAEWEASKAEIVVKAGNTAPGAVSLATFRAQAADLMANSSELESDSADAWRDVEETKQAFDVAQSKTTNESREGRLLRRTESDKAKLEGQLDVLSRRVKDLERENARLNTMGAQTSTVGL